MPDLAALVRGLVPPFAMAGVAVACGGAAPAFHIATAPGLVCGPETLWRAASISKVVTGRVVLAAVGPDGADMAAEVALGWPLRYPRRPERPVTLGQLASHTSGLSDADGYLVPTGAALSEWFATRRVWGVNDPGTLAYCNLGYVLLAAVAERLTGERFDILSQRVLGPLGITGGFNWSGVVDRRDRIATFRRVGANLVAQIDAKVAPQGISGPDGDEVTQPWVAGRNPGVFSPQGGLRLSLAGALRLARALDPEPLLWRGEDAICQGYGWGVMLLDRPDLYPRPLIGHFANAHGMCGGIWRDPAAGLSFAYVLNGLPQGDEDDRIREEELAILSAVAESAA